jgi:hypothetical protein
MRLFHSKTHAVVTTLLLCTFVVIDAFPMHGPPAFRYTGSDPKHLVWNFGWPIPWVIYDAYNPPFWFAWLGSRAWLLSIALIVQAAIIGACPILSWMIRKKDP